MLLLHNLHWTGTANISCMPINVCHISLGYTGFRIPQSDHSVDPAAIATGASWSGSYCNIPKCQLFSQFLTITNKHVRVNTDVLIQIPPCHHTPIRRQNGRKRVLVSGEPALLFLRTGRLVEEKELKLVDCHEGFLIQILYLN